LKFGTLAGICRYYEDVYSPMKAAQQEHKHTDRDTNVKDRQRTELSKDIKTRIHVLWLHITI